MVWNKLAPKFIQPHFATVVLNTWIQINSYTVRIFLYRIRPSVERISLFDINDFVTCKQNSNARRELNDIISFETHNNTCKSIHKPKERTRINFYVTTEHVCSLTSPNTASRREISFVQFNQTLLHSDTFTWLVISFTSSVITEPDYILNQFVTNTA